MSVVAFIYDFEVHLVIRNFPRVSVKRSLMKNSRVLNDAIQGWVYQIGYHLAPPMNIKTGKTNKIISKAYNLPRIPLSNFFPLSKFFTSTETILHLKSVSRYDKSFIYKQNNFCPPRNRFSNLFLDYQLRV